MLVAHVVDFLCRGLDWLRMELQKLHGLKSTTVRGVNDEIKFLSRRVRLTKGGHEQSADPRKDCLMDERRVMESNGVAVPTGEVR